MTREMAYSLLDTWRLVGDKEMKHLPPLYAALLFLFAAPSWSADIQSLDAIKTAVRSFLARPDPAGTRHEITVANLDARLKLAACAMPLEVFFAPGSRTQGTTTVGVRCKNSKPWQIYVPAQVKIYTQVLMTSQPLGRGEILEKKHVAWSEREVTGLSSGYFTEYPPALGKIVTRPLPAGWVLNPGALISPKAVKRGDTVTLLVAIDGLEVRAQGEALMDGALNDTIKVRNLLSQNIVEGPITAPGVVRIAP